MRHPREVLHDNRLGGSVGGIFSPSAGASADGATADIPVCDHYCGTLERVDKALALQAALMRELGVCPIDVTLDCEDGAPVGDEIAHAKALSVAASIRFDAIDIGLPGALQPRCAVRVHPVGHPAFVTDVAHLVAPQAHRLSHVMLPKVECLGDVEWAQAAIDAAVDGVHGAGKVRLALHALIESPLAVHHAFDIAGHPRIASLSFGLMDFVSSHGGALSEHAMSATGQFTDPQVVRAKLAVAAACHAHKKVPSHCVVTEFTDLDAIQNAAAQAKAMGYMRMWSIHPKQIQPILRAFAPSGAEVDKAAGLLTQAQQADWAPIRYGNVLHDRASYRLYWQILQRARRAGQTLPSAVAHWLP